MLRYFLITLMTFFLLSFHSPSDAQLINYKRLQRRPATVQSSLDEVKNSSDSAESRRSQTSSSQTSQTQENTRPQNTVRSAQDDMAALLRSQPLISSRVERIYDLNQDSKLQEEEIREFFTDVVSAVERRGSFSVGSDLLKPFDSDGDGQISEAELDTIRATLNE